MRKQIRELATNRALVFSILALAVAYSLYKGYIGASEMRNFDLRWFFAAGNCYAQGLSPYDFDSFSSCWRKDLGDQRIGPFVFLPTAFFFVLPISQLDWNATQAFATASGVLSLLALSMILVRLSAMTSRPGKTNLTTAIGLAFGLSITGIPGTLLVGQPTVAVALGVALLFLYLRDRTCSALVLGLLLAAIKLHLALFLALLATAVGLRRAPFAVLITVIIAFGCTLALAGSPMTFLGDYLESLRIHAGSEISQLHRPETLTGLLGLSFADAIYSLPVLATTAALGLLLLVCGFYETHSDFSRTELTGVLALLLSFVAFQLKIYDLAALAPIYAQATRLSRRSLAVVAVPLVILWRPRLLEALVGDTLNTAQIATVMVLALSCFFLGLLLSNVKRARS